MPEQRVTFNEEQLTRVEACLQKLLTKGKGIAVLFADDQGQPLGQVGKLDGIDGVALSTLTAGSFAATVAMAKLIGRGGAFEQLFFEGEHQGVYSLVVGEGFLLTVAFDSNAKPGLVRLLAKEVAWELLTIVGQAQKQAMEGPVEDLIDAEFGNSLADELDSLFPSDGSEPIDD
jgi:predicted regulator of Ras-like GTPase activity (Roadblock/LC7/MglB family)